MTQSASCKPHRDAPVLQQPVSAVNKVLCRHLMSQLGYTQQYYGMYQYQPAVFGVDPSIDPSVVTPIGAHACAGSLAQPCGVPWNLQAYSLAPRRAVSSRPQCWCCAAQDPSINGSFRVIGSSGVPAIHVRPISACRRTSRVPWLTGVVAVQMIPAASGDILIFARCRCCRCCC